MHEKSVTGVCESKRACIYLKDAQRKQKVFFQIGNRVNLYIQQRRRKSPEKETPDKTFFTFDKSVNRFNIKVMSGDISRLGKRDIANISAVENNMLFKPAKGRRSGVASALLCFTCGLCVILSLLCSLLATAVVVLGQKVEAFESRRSTSEYFS